MSIGSRDLQVPAAAAVSWRVRVWAQSFRLKFLPQGVLPVVLGSVVAWTQTRRFDPGFFALAFIGSACVQIGLTMLNDTLDYIYGTDRSKTTEKNPFSGGSGVLADGLLRPNETLTVAALFYIIAAVIGAYLTFRVGMGVFWMALLGFFLSVFYSVKPLRFAHRGVGEVAMLIGYGPTITLGAAYVQTGRFSQMAGLASLVPGLLMWSMILVNEMPDYTDDLLAKKMNLTVRLGPDRVRWLYSASLTGIYLYIIGGAVAKAFPIWTLMALVTMPFAFHSCRVVHAQKTMTTANRAMVTTYSSTMLLFCLGLWLNKVL